MHWSRSYLRSDLIQVYSGVAPFQGENAMEIILKIVNGEPPGPQPPLMDDTLWHEALDCWNSDALVRPTARVCAATLNGSRERAGREM